MGASLRGPDFWKLPCADLIKKPLVSYGVLKRNPVVLGIQKQGILNQSPIVVCGIQTGSWVYTAATRMLKLRLSGRFLLQECVMPFGFEVLFGGCCSLRFLDLPYINRQPISNLIKNVSLAETRRDTQMHEIQMQETLGTAASDGRFQLLALREMPFVKSSLPAAFCGCLSAECIRGC